MSSRRRSRSQTRAREREARNKRDTYKNKAGRARPYLYSALLQSSKQKSDRRTKLCLETAWLHGAGHPRASQPSSLRRELSNRKDAWNDGEGHQQEEGVFGVDSGVQQSIRDDWLLCCAYGEILDGFGTFGGAESIPQDTYTACPQVSRGVHITRDFSSWMLEFPSILLWLDSSRLLSHPALLCSLFSFVPDTSRASSGYFYTETEPICCCG